MENHRGNIVLVGVLDRPGSTNLYMAKAFEKAGFNVIPVNYRSIIPNTGPNTISKLLWKLAQDEPKLMLFSKFNGVESLVLGKCGQIVPTWLWFMDGVRTLKMVPECVQHAQLATYASFTGLGVLNYVKKTIGTGEGMFHIMEGIDQEVYRPVVTTDEHACDVAFIGTNNPERTRYIHMLIEAGYNVKAYGQGFNNEVHGVEFNLACSSAKAMLALSAEYNTQAYFSDRVFRYGAAGAFVVHKHALGLDKYFQHQQDVVYFDKEETLLEILDYYIRQNRVDERNAIAQNLHNKVIANHTWDKVIEQICSIVKI